jgi:hypothetical protein
MAVDSPKMWKFGLSDRFDKVGGPNSRIEIRQTAGFRPKTTGFCEIAE